jgi:hypothetical protein
MPDRVLTTAVVVDTWGLRMATALCVVHIFPLPPLRHLTHSDTRPMEHAYVRDGQEGPAQKSGCGFWPRKCRGMRPIISTHQADNWLYEEPNIQPYSWVRWNGTRRGRLLVMKYQSVAAAARADRSPICSPNFLLWRDLSRTSIVALLPRHARNPSNHEYIPNLSTLCDP